MVVTFLVQKLVRRHHIHCVTSVQIRSFSVPHFPLFRLNADIYGVNLCIQSKYGKIRTTNNPYLDIFQAVIAWKVFLFGVFLVRIFPHSDWIQRNTPYLSVFSPNTAKYGPGKLRIRTLSTECQLLLWD